MKRYLNKNDLALIKERARLKAKLKKLESVLKPRIAEACDALGDGATVNVDGKVIELQRIKAEITEWRTLAYSLATEQEIIEVQPLYTKERITRKAVVI